MFSDSVNKTRLLWAIGIIFVVIPVISFIIYSIYLNINNATLILNIAPDTTNITLSPNQTSLKIGNNHLKPGTYTLNLSADGFYPHSQEISLSENETLELYIALDPTPDNQDFYLNHMSQYGEILQYITDEEFDDMENASLEESPIAAELPAEELGIWTAGIAMNTDEFTISVTIFSDKESTPAFIEAGKQSFLTWLETYRNNTGDRKDYPIEYSIY